MSETNPKFTVTIDGQSVQVDPGTTILNAARMIGGDVVPPAMCYYSSLKGSGGKCRTCLVEVSKGSEKDPRPMPKLVASCSTPIMDGMEVKNKSSEKVNEARAGVVEMLLINHPLDCPVCDQAGECHLQDLAYEHGKSNTRYEFERRTFDKVDIKNLKNDFIGNVIDVCPVGALTDKTFRFRSRVWYTKPMDANRDCKCCSGKAVVWMIGDEIARVTARKDQYGEVKEFICNECRFDKKEKSDWNIEGPRQIDRSSVISANHYEVDAPEHTPLLNKA